jgi:hypothetical protein
VDSPFRAHVRKAWRAEALDPRGLAWSDRSTLMNQHRPAKPYLPHLPPTSAPNQGPRMAVRGVALAEPGARLATVGM